MASFTDSPQAFFSPAAPMVDLNLYGQTLDYKQSQYNQGVQRIQGSIDQVAGLDIMHPLAKDYLHNKLTELGTQLNSVAGGDFSAQSLVNQALALAPQVAKDEKIQTALMSTQQIRALSASQKKLYDKHPEMYPSSMRYMDNKAVSEYLNSTNLDEGYHGTSEASRYTDYNKDIEGLVKQIVPDVKLEVNADGKYQWKTEKYSTVTNDRIQSVISGYLSSHPEASRSLNADALYTYKDASPQFLAHHLEETYSRNIHALKGINQQYLNEIISHPTSRDFIEDRRAAMAANEKSIQEMYSKRNLFRQYLENPDMHDQVKQTVFADNLKGMYSTIFQKDDIDRKIEENFNAKNADDFYIKKSQLDINRGEFGLHQIKTKEELIASGNEPYLDKFGNPIPLTPESKYWPQYQAHIKKGKKGDGTDGGSGADDLPFSGEPQVGGKVPEDKYGNTTLLESQKKILMDAIHNETGTGLEDMFFNKWYQKNSALIPDKQMARVSFDEMIKAQKNAFQEGQPTTAEFREYWSKASMYQLKLDALEQLKEKALTYSQNKVPMPAQDKDYHEAVHDIFTKLGTTYLGYGGINPDVVQQNINKYPIGSLPSDNDPDYLKKHPAKMIEYTKYNREHKIYDMKNHSGEPYYQVDGMPADVDNNIIIARAEHAKFIKSIEKYKNKPAVYNRLLKDEFTSFRDSRPFTNTQSVYSNINSQRQSATEEYLKQNEKDYAPQEYSFAGKDGDEAYKQAQKTVLSLLTNTQGVAELDKYDLKKHDLEDIQVLAASTDPTGKVKYKFKIKGQNADYITSTQAGGAGILPQDPDRELKQVIHITGMTPTKGDGVLATKDSKIRFAIGESTYDKNAYDAYVIVKGVPMEIKTVLPNGDIFHGASPSQIIKSLEDIARQPSRSNPKVPMSREECYDKLTMDPHEYEAKYPKPTTQTK